MTFRKKSWSRCTRIPNTILFAMLVSIMPAVAQTQTFGFGPLFSSNMVVPYGRNFSLNGHATPNTSLTLEVEDAHYNLRSNAAGKWETTIKPLAAGGPYTINLRSSSGEEAVLNNVLAGNIWVCSGQSNMAYPVTASTDQPDSYNQGHSAIRLLSVPQRTELTPQSDFKESLPWQVATKDSVKNFSAVCYFFARTMMEQEGIPLGLVNASWGGAAIEAWISEQSLAGIAGFNRKVNLLQLYRKDRREAELAFSEDWIQWWRQHSNQGDVWKLGLLDKKADWHDAPLQNYRTYPDERLKDHVGIIWFAKIFELTKEQQAKKAAFILGGIDEVDSTWINGKFINNSFGYGTRREYPLEPGVLQQGINQITVNVLNTWAAGGMTGPANEVGIKFEDGEFLPLGADWKYRYIPHVTGQPPRSPWESVSGISGMFNGMIAPLKALQPEGAVWYQGESNTEYSQTYHSLLTALIGDWRRYFNRQFPFIVVQLPNYGAVAATPVNSGWATIRNAQQQVALEDKLVGLAVTQDAGEDSDIHPKRKWIVGARVARSAIALQGIGAPDGVVPTIVHRNAATSVELQFSPALLPEEKKEISGFILCRESGCKQANASQSGSRILIRMDALPDATKLRFCWSDGGECGLKAMNNLPVGSFEMDLK